MKICLPYSFSVFLSFFSLLFFFSFLCILCGSLFSPLYQLLPPTTSTFIWFHYYPFPLCFHSFPPPLQLTYLLSIPSLSFVVLCVISYLFLFFFYGSVSYNFLFYRLYKRTSFCFYMGAASPFLFILMSFLLLLSPFCFCCSQFHYLYGTGCSLLYRCLCPSMVLSFSLLSVCLSVCLSVLFFISLCVCLCLCMYVCVCVCMCDYVYLVGRQCVCKCLNVSEELHNK